LCPDMEHIELQDFHLDDQEVEDKIGVMKNLKELRVRSIKMPSNVTSNVLFCLPLIDAHGLKIQGGRGDT
jgi:hypothetical protein